MMETVTKTDKELIVLMAEFHGWTKRKVGKGTGEWLWDFPSWNRSNFSADSLKYYELWDWVMPVWIKFRNLDLELGSGHAEWVDALQWYLFSSDEPKRFAERLAYAIKWYNELNQPKI